MLLVLLAGSAAAADAALGDADFRPDPTHSVGWRGDGSGVFPGARPILKWSDGTAAGDGRGRKGRATAIASGGGGQGPGIRWRLQMPNWSNASPIVVGDRVFVMSEPLELAPELICVDAARGTIRWRRSVDHLSTLPTDEAALVRERWWHYRSLARRLAVLQAERKALAAGAPVEGGLTAWRERAAKLGAGAMEIEAKWGGVSCKDLLGRAQMDEIKNLEERFGCAWGKWELGFPKNDRLQVGAYIGFTTPTPVSDGETVYVFTGLNTVAAFDLAGTQRWLRFLGPYDPPRAGGWVDFTQSPVLVGDTLLVGTKAHLTALDTASGQVRWRHDIDPGHLKQILGYDNLLMTGVAGRLGGVDAFLWIDACLYRVADGKRLGERLLGDAGLLGSCGPVWHGDRILLTATGGKKEPDLLRAFRLEAAGAEAPRAIPLWSHPCDQLPFTGVCLGDRYLLPTRRFKDPAIGNQARDGHRDPALDLADGSATPFADFWPDHFSGLSVAGGHFFTVESLRCGACRIRVHDPNGRLVVSNLLMAPPPDAERLRLIRSLCGRDTWHDGSYHGSCHSLPFFHGERIYLRTRDEVLCLGPM